MLRTLGLPLLLIATILAHEIGAAWVQYKERDFGNQSAFTVVYYPEQFQRLLPEYHGYLIYSPVVNSPRVSVCGFRPPTTCDDFFCSERFIPPRSNETDVAQFISMANFCQYCIVSPSSDGSDGGNDASNGGDSSDGDSGNNYSSSSNSRNENHINKNRNGNYINNNKNRNDINNNYNNNNHSFSRTVQQFLDFHTNVSRGRCPHFPLMDRTHCTQKTSGYPLLTDILFNTSQNSNSNTSDAPPPFICYCDSWDTFGFQCDWYTQFAILGNYLVRPVVSLLFTIVYVLLVLFLSLLPECFVVARKCTRFSGCERLSWRALRPCFSVRVQVLLFLLLSLLMLVVEQVLSTGYNFSQFKSIRDSLVGGFFR